MYLFSIGTLQFTLQRCVNTCALVTSTCVHAALHHCFNYETQCSFQFAFRLHTMKQDVDMSIILNHGLTEH